jgi:copper chaperone CopZ
VSFHFQINVYWILGQRYFNSEYDCWVRNFPASIFGIFYIKLSTMKKEAYLVEGMTCSGCERAIQKAVSNIKGVSMAKAELSASTVTVEYDPKSTSIGEIKNVINNLGYKLVAERPTAGQREGSDEAIS